MKRKDNFLMRQVGGENILVPLGERVLDLNGIFTFNDTGSYIWELLEHDLSVDTVITCVYEQFEVEYERAIVDVHDFINKLNQFNLLISC